MVQLFICFLDVFASYVCPLVYQIAKLLSRFGLEGTNINVVAQSDGSKYANGQATYKGFNLVRNGQAHDAILQMQGHLG